MAYGVLQHRALDVSGNLLSDVDVEVRVETTAASLIQLYSDRDGTIPIGNPTVGGFFSDGKIKIYCLGGRYRVIVRKDGDLIDEFRDVPVGTAQELDIDSVKTGLLFNWDAGTSDVDPGDGNIRANNASLSSATFLYVDDLNRAGSNVEAFLLTLDDSTNTVKGQIILTDAATEEQATFSVSAVTDALGYVKIEVSGHSVATSFSTGAPIGFSFFRSGDLGADSVTNTNLANMPAYTLKGRNAGTTGDPSDIDVSALTEKVTPLADDLLLIQDSAASNAFKKLKLGNVAASGVDVQTFTTPGGNTWTKPASGTIALFQIWGAAGGGARRSSGNGAGGGGGGYDEFWMRLSDLAALENVFIASGGAQQNTDNTSGNAGGTTTVGSFYAMYGGRGGAQAASGNAVLGGGPGGLVDIWSFGYQNNLASPLRVGQPRDGSSAQTSLTVNNVGTVRGGTGVDAANIVSSVTPFTIYGGGGGGHSTAGGPANGAPVTSLLAGSGGTGNGAGAGFAGGNPSGGGGSGTTAGGAGGNAKVVVTVF